MPHPLHFFSTSTISICILRYFVIMATSAKSPTIAEGDVVIVFVVRRLR